jgi:hypothetical protein
MENIMENIIEIYNEFGDFGSPNSIYLITQELSK